MTLHRHDDGCRVPLDQLFEPLPGGRKNNMHYYTERAADGRLFTQLNGYYALEGCSFMRIPIFLGKKPKEM